MLIKNKRVLADQNQEIIADEEEHLKLLLSAMRQHVSDMEKYNASLGSDLVGHKIQVIKSSLDSIEKEIV